MGPSVAGLVEPGGELELLARLGVALLLALSSTIIVVKLFTAASWTTSTDGSRSACSSSRTSWSSS